MLSLLLGVHFSSETKLHNMQGQVAHRWGMELLLSSDHSGLADLQQGSSSTSLHGIMVCMLQLGGFVLVDYDYFYGS